MDSKATATKVWLFRSPEDVDGGPFSVPESFHFDPQFHFGCQILGYDLEDLITNGPEEKLRA